jgi:hypothetical protein
MKITPCYLYGNQYNPEVGDGFLFHFTKFESFLKILETMTLRSSPLCKMNDLNEADLSGIDWSKEFLVMYNAQKYIRTQCSVISFSQNYEVESICREGANNPAMWAYYAENSDGVCIVLDRDALIENNRDSLKDVFYVLEDVEYTCDHNPHMEVLPGDYSTASDLVHKNYKEIFFKKDIVWKNEGEVRFLVESPEFYLDIKDAIKYIVLGKRLIDNRENMCQMLSLIATSDNLNKDYFIPHSFATFSSSQGGYLVHDASHHIVQYLHEMNEEAVVL